jgi:hypothetical protein
VLLDVLSYFYLSLFPVLSGIVLERLKAGNSDLTLGIAASFFADASCNQLSKAWIGDQFIEPLFHALANCYTNRSMDAALFTSISEMFRNCCANHEPNQLMLASLLLEQLRGDGKLTPFTARMSSFAMTLSDTMSVCLVSSTPATSVCFLHLFMFKIFFSACRFVSLNHLKQPVIILILNRRTSTLKRSNSPSRVLKY